MKKLDLSDYLTQVVVAFFAIAACKLIARQFDEPNKGLGTSAEGRASPPGVGGADSRQKEIKTQNRIHAGLVDQCRKGHLPTEDWATLANRLGLKIEMLQKEVAVVVISNIKVHKDHAPSDAVLPPAEQESNLRNRLNSHLTAVGKAFKEDEGIDL